MNRRLDFSPSHDRNAGVDQHFSREIPPNFRETAMSYNEHVAKILDDVSPDALLVANDTELAQLLGNLRRIYPAENFSVTRFSGDPFKDREDRWQFRWNDDVQLSGKLLVTLDTAIGAAKSHDMYYDTPFSDDVDAILASIPQDCSPLLRRKVAAMEQRNTAYTNLPTDPHLLREVLTRFSDYIYTVDAGKVTYVSDLLRENPDFIKSTSDNALLTRDWKTYFTGDEGYAEFMTQHRLASRDLRDIPHPKEIKNGIVTKLTPTKFGAFDSLGRFRGMVNPHDGTLIAIGNDQDVQSLARHSSLDAIASDVAFAFDLDMRDQLSQDLNLPIEQLTLNEQITLVGALRNSTPEKERHLIDFVRHYHLEGARAFLATVIDEKADDSLIQLPEKYEKPEVQRILSAFCELIDVASRTAKEITDSFSASGQLNVDIDLVRTELLRRGTSLLKEASQTKMDANKLARTFEHAKADIALFTTIFRLTRKEHPELGFEDIRGVSLSSQRGNELDPHDQRVMRAIALQNWMQQKPEVAEKILSGLDTAMQSSNTEFFLLKKEDDVAAFIRFDKRTDGSLYGASLNVNPALRGSGIGESMMHAAIDKMAKNHVIAADVFPELPVGMKYVEDFGCVITGVESVQTEDGSHVERFILRRDDARNSHYQKHVDSGNNARIERFDTRQGTEEMITAVKKAAARGEVATRYYSEDTRGIVRYLVFEPEVTITKLQLAA